MFTGRECGIDSSGSVPSGVWKQKERDGGC